LIPTFIFLVFVATPFIYAMLNHLSSPSPDSIDTIWDERSNSTLNNKFDKISPNTLSQIPEIYDIDVAIINNYVSDRHR